jgi:hypothetical protein
MLLEFGSRKFAGVFGARAWLESKNKGVEEGGRGEALQNICPELC